MCSNLEDENNESFIVSKGKKVAVWSLLKSIYSYDFEKRKVAYLLIIEF